VPRFRHILPGAATLGIAFFLLGSATNPAAAPLDDSAILGILATASAIEIETGTLAEQRGAAKEVKAMGTRLKEDHTRAQREGEELARKINVTVTPANKDSVAGDEAGELAELSTKTGEDFDRAFLDVQEDLHEETIEDIQKKFLPAATSPELKAFLQQLVPQLQSHLDMAKAAKKQIS
jgi:putative membrane protein